MVGEEACTAAFLVAAFLVVEVACIWVSGAVSWEVVRILVAEAGRG